MKSRNKLMFNYDQDVDANEARDKVVKELEKAGIPYKVEYATISFRDSWGY
jgi:hypothetical protein